MPLSALRMIGREETKERLRKRIVLANVLSFRFFIRSRGTCERTLVPAFVPEKNECTLVSVFRSGGTSAKTTIFEDHPFANTRIGQERPGNPNASTFCKVPPYKWEAYCHKIRKRTAVQMGGVPQGFPELSLSSRPRSQEGTAIQMEGLLPYKLQVYCSTFRQAVQVGVSQTCPIGVKKVEYIMKIVGNLTAVTRCNTLHHENCQDFT